MQTPLLSTCYSLNTGIGQKWSDEGEKKKMGIVNFFVSRRVSVGWLSILITGDF